MITGGRLGSASHGSKLVDLYDPAHQVFLSIDDMLEARRDHSATLLTNGNVLVAGTNAINIAGYMGLANGKSQARQFRNRIPDRARDEVEDLVLNHLGSWPGATLMRKVHSGPESYLGIAVGI